MERNEGGKEAREGDQEGKYGSNFTVFESHCL